MPAFSRILIFTAVALLGYLLLPRLSIRWQPSSRAASLRISYGLPSADPALLEREVTAPLEAAVALVDGVQDIYSVSGVGSGYVDLQLDERVAADYVRFNVASQIRRLYPKLPPGVSYPNITVNADRDDDAPDLPVMTYTLSGPDDPTELYRYATDNLLPRLSLLEGLDRLEVVGGNRLHWRIDLDPDQMKALGLDLATVQTQLTGRFGRSGLGQLTEQGGRQFYVALQEDQPLVAADWQSVLISNTSGRLIYLRDVATVERLPLPATSYYRSNGQSSVRLIAYATPTANRIALAQQLGTRVLALNTELRSGYALRLDEDNTRYLREELRKTRRRTALSLGVLLVFVLIAYRSISRLIIVLYSLVVNLGLAFLGYWLLGVELNLYAFAGIAVSFGIMIDNVIIVLDGLSKGGPEAARRVRPAVIGATLTSLASLSVIYLLSDELRDQLFELARVMVINLTTSVLVAIYFVPALSRGMEAKTSEAANHDSLLFRTYIRLLSFTTTWKKSVLLIVVLAFGLPVWWLPRKVEGLAWYNKTFGSEYYQHTLRPTVNKYLGGSFRLFNYYVYADGGFRRPEETRLFVGAALPDGATVDQLDAVVRQVEAYLATFSDRVDRYTTQVYSGQNARISITFSEQGKGGFPATLKNRLTTYATNFGGVTWNIYGVGIGFSNDRRNGLAGFNVLMKGYNLEGLDQYAGRLAELLLKHPRVQKVDADANLNWWEKERSEYILSPHPESLARASLDIASLRRDLQWFNQNRQPSLYLPDGEPVSLGNAATAEYDRWRLANWRLENTNGSYLLESIAQLDKRVTATALHKKDQQYLRRIAFDYLGSSRFGSRHLDNCLDTLRTELPLGFSVERGSRSADEEARELVKLIGLALLLIFLICAVLFESVRQGMAVVLLVPVTCIGIFLTFYLFDVSLDQGGYVSFLLVTGLAVNGLILIINEYNYLRGSLPTHSGVERYALAVWHKLLPVVLTVASTAAGLLPFIIGAEGEVFWYGLAMGTVGGLVFSVFVLLFVSPVFLLRRNV